MPITKSKSRKKCTPCCTGDGPCSCSTCNYYLALWWPDAISIHDYVLHINGNDFPFSLANCSGTYNPVHVFGDCDSFCYDSLILPNYDETGSYQCPVICHDTALLTDVNCIGDETLFPITLEYIGFTGGSGGFSSPFFYWYHKICDDTEDPDKCCFGDEQFWPSNGGPGYETDSLTNSSTYGMEGTPCCVLEGARKAKRKARSPQKVVFPPCLDWSKELLAGEVAAKGLDVRKRWYACSTGEHPAHCNCSSKT